MKKVLIIILIVILAALAAFGWYVFFYTNNDGAGTATSTQREVRRFSPFGIFGKTPASDSGNEFPSETVVVKDRETFIPPVQQITNEPVAAALFVSTGSTTALRYIDRATGHIFDAFATSTATIPITNTTVPRIQEAFWIDGAHPLVRYLDENTDTIQTFVGEIHEAVGTSADGFLTGDFLAPDLDTITVQRNGGIFYLTNTESGSVGTTLTLAGDSKQVFSSPLREWVPDWVGESALGLTTKPSSRVAGYAFLVNPKTGSFKKILGGVSGLTTRLRPDGGALLYVSSGNSFVLSVLDIASGASRNFSVQTLPEKCVWSVLDPDTLYCAVPEALTARDLPDSWYRGDVLFTDAILKINTLSGGAEELQTTDGFAGERVDAVGLTLDEEELFLSFINKRDGSLWLVRL